MYKQTSTASPGNSLEVINDVTQLNPIKVSSILTPKIVDEIVDAIKSHTGKICIGGGRYSMGGQTALEQALHIDMRSFNQIVSYSPEEKIITVQAGCRWRDIQEHIDKDNLSISIMQTYSNFTVGGSLSVNSHGRYMGMGPLVLSVLGIKVVLADGSLVEASPQNNASIFYGVIGGYGGLGVIIEATLKLAENCRISRHHTELNIKDYYDYFKENVKNTQYAIFHNTDIYPPNYKKGRAVTWFVTFEPVTEKERLIPKNKSYPLQRYFLWAVSETLTGKWRRQLYIDPIFYLSKRVVWRNFEASYDVAELEPVSREKSTYVLQEYFVPVELFYEFVEKMSNILKRYHVNVLNISIRHAIKDPGTLLAWAKSEVFAFVLYYKEKVSDIEKHTVAIWTRELIDAAISCNGSYYLPYQPHARISQFHAAYPNARAFLALKERLDPSYMFDNKLWQKYYQQNELTEKNSVSDSEFKEIFSNTKSRDDFYLFLQNIYNIYPENEFHFLIHKITQDFETDKEIYEAIQKKLPELKVFLNDLRYALPALFYQKKEITKQTLSLLDVKTPINGILEIGSTGRYVSDLRKHFKISNVYFLHDTPPSRSLVDIAERERLKPYGKFLPLNDYGPIKEQDIPTASIDVVLCYIGLHHAPKEKIDDFVQSLNRILRPGGSLILREHSVATSKMHAFVSLVHAVFNLGLNVSWEQNLKELRHFNSIEYWLQYLSSHGFAQQGEMILQEHDPSLNTLLRLVKK